MNKQKPEDEAFSTERRLSTRHSFQGAVSLPFTSLSNSQKYDENRSTVNNKMVIYQEFI
jgi:hypothetical protein